MPYVFACNLIDDDKLVFGFPVVGKHWVFEFAVCRADNSFLSSIFLSNGTIDRTSKNGEGTMAFVEAVLSVNAGINPLSGSIFSSKILPIFVFVRDVVIADSFDVGFSFLIVVLLVSLVDTFRSID